MPWMKEQDNVWMHIIVLCIFMRPTLSEVLFSPSRGNGGLSGIGSEESSSPKSNTTSPADSPKGKNSSTGIQFTSMEQKTNNNRHTLIFVIYTQNTGLYCMHVARFVEVSLTETVSCVVTGST